MKKIAENSNPLQSVHFNIWFVIIQSGDDVSLRALTEIPKTVDPTVSEVYMVNISCKYINVFEIVDNCLNIISRL